MSYQMNIDEMLDSLTKSKHPLAGELTALVETTADLLAKVICEQHDIDCGEASFEGSDFAGTTVPFYPKHQGQKLPDAIAGYDSDDEWDEEDT